MAEEDALSSQKYSEIFSLFTSEEVLQEDLQAIATYKYPPMCLRALEHFRYILSCKEYSERGMKLSELILSQLKNHYALWEYRSEYLLGINLRSSFEEELNFCNQSIRDDPKGFQTWHHRRFVYEQLNSIDYPLECEFLSELLLQDAKNYHLWSFRTWLADRFELWKKELLYVDDMLPADVFNNSLWSYRHFLTRRIGVRLEEEENFCWRSIRASPNNESIWNYFLSLYSCGLSPAASEKIHQFLHERGDEFFGLRALLINQVGLPRGERDATQSKDWIARMRLRAQNREKLADFFEQQLSESEESGVHDII